VIASPPLSAGALKSTVTELEPSVMPSIDGAPGAVVASCSGSDGSDAADGPSSLCAVTVQVYVWPLPSPLTTIGEPLPLAEPAGPVPVQSTA